MPRRSIPQFDRIRIVALCQEGLSSREVSRRLRVNQSDVIRTWKRYRDTGTVDDMPRSGRPRVTTATVSTNASNKPAPRAKKVKKSKQIKIEQILEPEIVCEIEEASLEYEKTSRVEGSSASRLASEVKSEPLSEDEGRNSSGDVAVTQTTAANRTSFAAVFVKEEPQSTESEMELPVTEKLNMGRNSSGDVAVTQTTAANRTSFAAVFVKEEPQSTESEMELPVTEKLNMIEVEGELIEAALEEKVATDS